ncbi:MAG: hypothetical protein PHD57_11565 [Desulfobacterales bacterium]|nr:hypothetical protein [Desulfobacterales bacterium]
MDKTVFADEGIHHLKRRRLVIEGPHMHALHTKTFGKYLERHELRLADH